MVSRVSIIGFGKGWMKIVRRVIGARESLGKKLMDEFEKLIRQERELQDLKWGEMNHHPCVWLAVLMEEVGELARAILDAHSVQQELIQVAAVAKVMWESGKRNGWL